MRNSGHWYIRLVLVALGAFTATVWSGSNAAMMHAQSSQAPTERQLGQKCSSLAGLILRGDAKITAAVVGPEQGKGAQTPGSYCKVDVQALDSALKLRVDLPLVGWNHKLVELGGGGFKGHIPPLFSYNGSMPARFHDATLITWLQGYAVVASNGGHDAEVDGANTAFALDPIKLTEYTYLAEHRTALFAKALAEHFYGKPPDRSYFLGGSMGGHDALMEAQRYPLDFDGIVAWAPVGNVMGAFLQFNRISTQLRKVGATLNPAKQTLLANAVLAQCDAQDGLVDGIISKLEACDYDPAPLRCAGGADTSDFCLSDLQIATVKVITSPYRTADGRWSHPGFSFGGENNMDDGWGQWIWPLPPSTDALPPQGAQGLNPSKEKPAVSLSKQMSYSDQWVRGFVTHDLSFDGVQFNADRYLPELYTIGSLWQAFDPDLSPFLAHGGKLIIANGTIDTAVTPRDAIRYYNMVVQKMGQANADNVVEMFLAAGVGHSYAGPGPSDVDWLKAVSTWVEQGAPPSKQGLILQKIEPDGSVSKSRPACKYPAYARYRGNGDPKLADSYMCSKE